MARKFGAKDKRKQSTPARRLLNRIRPYSAELLAYHRNVILHFFAKDPELSNTAGYFHRYAHEIINKTNQNQNFQFLNDPDRVRAFQWQLTMVFWLLPAFENPPTISEYEADVKVFRKIAVKFPGKISEAASVLSSKYGYLLKVSEDFSGWHSWLWHSKLRASGPNLFEEFIGSDKSAGPNAIKLADDILDVIPPDLELRTGRPRNYFARKIAEETFLYWRFCGQEPCEYRNLFHSYLRTLVANARRAFGPDNCPEILGALSATEEHDPNWINQVAAETISERDNARVWAKAPQRVIYYGNYSRFSRVWFSIESRRLIRKLPLVPKFEDPRDPKRLRQRRAKKREELKNKILKKILFFKSL